jgi:hypothetical protein
MNQNLLDEFNIIYDRYIRNRESYRTDVVRPNTHINDVVFNIINDNAPPLKTINNVLTNSVTKYFLNSTETTLEIINLYVNIYEHAINKYIETHPEFNLNENIIWFTLKGGLAMFLNISKEVFKMSGKIGENFNDLFVNNAFSKSDIDFSILIDYRKIDEVHHQTIFMDMSNISFIILVMVRNYIVKNKYEFSDFEKNNDEYKKFILKKIRKNINRVLLDNRIGVLGNNFCKIGTSKIYEEEPCPNNVEITNDIAYDEFFVHSEDNFNNITINHPRRFGHFYLEPQNKYIISTNIIQFINAENNLTKFGLTRMKVFFGLYKLNINGTTLGCCDYKKGKGEIIDVSINHFENHYIPDNNNYNRFQINNYEFIMPTIDYFKKEHYEMLVIFYNFPWKLPKFDKRIRRYLALSFITILRIINKDNIEHFICFFKAYSKYLELNNSDPIYVNNPMTNNQFVYPGIDENLNPNEFEIMTLLNQTIMRLNDDNYNIELNKFIEFINILSLNINNMILMLNEINEQINNPVLTFNNNNLSLRTNMIGGVDICNTDNSQKILKNIINKLINISTNLSLNTTIHDRFYSSYTKLYQIYLDDTIINQNFIDNFNNTIYNSYIDNTDDMIDFNGNRKILKNSILNYTAFMFLDFLLDYHSFLITFQNERYNTDVNNVQNGSKNFMLLEWDGDPARESDLYRHELIGKNPSDLLTDFCNDINTKFYRFITLLLKNLSNKLARYLPINLPPNQPIPPNLASITINDLREIMFCCNHKGIDNYNETSVYNYMYHCWKNRLAKWMLQKYNGLNENNFPATITAYPAIDLTNLKNYFITIINDCILQTIENISSQNGVNQLNERYISDNGGLFSYSYAIRRPLIINNKCNKKTYFGSCISSSLIEIYFLIRIYEMPNDVGLGSESGVENIVDRHDYWTLTQNAIGHSITHWTCKWNRLVYNRHLQNFNNKIYKFRYYYTNMNNRTIMLTDNNSKKSFSKYFLFQLIDYRIEYIRQNNFNVNGFDKSQFLNNNLAVFIRNLIR